MPLSPAAAPAAPAALLAHTDSLALVASGRTRVFTVTNVGGQAALDIAVNPTDPLPPGTSMTTTCAFLAPGESCSVSIAPGSTPSAAPADTQALPAVLRIAGSNTEALDLAVHVLNLGSVYQGGYLFAIDDTTAETQSIGGKVLGPTDLTKPWLADNTGAAIDDTIDATSLTDGQANTREIVAYMEQRQPRVDPEHYPAGICDASNAGGHADWYLPAVCEFSYDMASPQKLQVCGNRTGPALANVQSALLDNGLPTGLTGATSWWSSTENGLLPTTRALHYIPNSEIWISAKSTQRGVACVRQLTP